MPTWSKNLLLALASFVVALIGIELIGRLFIRDPLALFRPSSALGYEMAPDYRGRHRKFSDFDVAVRTNAQGLREDDWPGSQPRRVALALGDSVAFGFGVEAEDSWPKQVQRLAATAGAPDLLVVNAGVWGYNTLQELSFLRGGAAGLRPDLIVVGLTVPVTIERNWGARELGVDTTEPLRSEGAGHYASPHALLKRHSHVYSFLDRRRRYHGSLLPSWAWLRARLAPAEQPAATGVDPAVAPPAIPETFPDLPIEASADFTVQLLLELRDAAARLDATIAVVLFPAVEQVAEVATQSGGGASRVRALRERLAERLAAAGVPCLDLTPALAARAGEEELFLPHDIVHPSRVGHERSAEAIAPFLVGLLPPAP